MANVTSKLQVTVLKLFDAATEHRRARHSGGKPGRGARSRGWARREIYEPSLTPMSASAVGMAVPHSTMAHPAEIRLRPYPRRTSTAHFPSGLRHGM